MSAPQDPSHDYSQGHPAAREALAIQRQPHPHQHEHRAGSPGAFRWSVILNSGLSGLQLVIGFGFGSLALISDAIHNLGDVAGLLLGWGAERLSTRPASGRFTYGFGRSTQLASLVNAVLILMASAVLVVEGVQRLGRGGHSIDSLPVAWAAAAGIAVNLFSAWLFGHDHHHDLNRRAARLHLLGDAAVSVAVLGSAIVVGITRLTWVDSLTAVLVGLAVGSSGWKLLRDAMVVAMDAVPDGIDLNDVERCLRALPGVVDVHHIHVWGMSTSQTALTAHVKRVIGSIDDMVLLPQAKADLAALGIAHSTIQLEPG